MIKREIAIQGFHGPIVNCMDVLVRAYVNVLDRFIIALLLLSIYRY